MYARVSLLTITIALLAGACTQPAQTSSHIVLPLDSYKMSAEQEATYFTALDILTQRCMRQQGHEWPILPITNQLRDPNSRRYGVASEDDASRFGYHPPPDPIGNEQEQTATKSNAVEQTALEGSATQPGCLDIASQQLDRGAPEADYGTLTTLDWDSLRVSEQHPQVVESQHAWSECMRERGYAYPRPQDAVEDPTWNLDGQAATAQEIAVARADVGCKQQVGLVETWVRVETDIQKRLIAEHQADLDKIRSATTYYVASASDVVAHRFDG